MLREHSGDQRSRHQGTDSGAKAQQIRFAAASGASCTIDGTLSDVRFLDAASIQFNLPGKGSQDDQVTVAWPSGLGALVRVGDLMAPVG